MATMAIMQSAEMGNITRVSKVSDKTPTLRTSIPLELAKGLGIGDKDSVSWTEATVQGKKGLFCRKVE
jgi:hypothetical protein